MDAPSNGRVDRPLRFPAGLQLAVHAPCHIDAKGRHLDIWTFESNPGKQTALALGSIVVGMTLAYGFRHHEGPGLSNSTAGFMLGLLLLVIGIAAFLVRGRQTIVIDPRARRIVVSDTSLFGRKTRTIALNDIVDTAIGYLGKRSSHVEFYYISLKLRNGEDYPLFAPGRFFEGASDRAIMEGRRQRLETYIGRDADR